MFTPQYTITEKLLANIKRINELVIRLNQRRFPQVVLVEMEKVARAVSSFASTSIEGNPLPLTEVKKILKTKPQHWRQSEREVINYNQALIEVNGKLKKKKISLTPSLILNIHKKVMLNLLPKYEWGKWRQRAVVVNDPRTFQTVFLPPNYQDVPKLMEDLIFFVKKTQVKIDPLILSGLFHKQMIIIHPFTDGNGRTTRLATKVLLANMGLNTFHFFSFENYYNQNVTRYFQTVGEYGDYYELKDKIDYTSWLEYFTEGIIDELLRVGKLLPKLSLSPQTKILPYHQKILDYINVHGFITDREYAQLTSRAKATRNLDFNKLINLGLIKRKSKGRATYYVIIM